MTTTTTTDGHHRRSSDVLVVLPAFNEEANVAFVIDEVRREGYDALVVDDGSTDRTGRGRRIGRRRGAPVCQSTSGLVARCDVPSVSRS